MTERAAEPGRMQPRPEVRDPLPAGSDAAGTASTGAAHGLHVIMRSAMTGTRGDFALVAVKVDTERLLIQSAIGPLAEDMIGNLMHVADSVAAPVLLTGEPVLVTDYAERGSAASEVRPRIGSVIVVPLTVDDRIEGALAVGRLAGQPSLTASELDSMSAFIRRTGTVRELEQAYEERRTAHLIEDRTRVRADLHDNVIQELFAAGMALQAVAARVSDRNHSRQILAQVDGLDATIQRIRNLISDGPRGVFDPPRLPLPKRLVAIVDSLTPALRCLPTVMFVGPVDSVVHGRLADDLEAVLREALSNVARHAGASSVSIKVAVTDRELVLDVIDDGRGFTGSSRRSGLTNMAVRAEHHGGNFRSANPVRGGTHVRWTAMISGGEAEPVVG